MSNKINKIAFITYRISSLMIKKDPFCIPYELARLGFNVVVITSHDSIHVPGCRMARIMNARSLSSKILPTYVINLLLTIVLILRCHKDIARCSQRECKCRNNLLLPITHMDTWAP